MRIPLFPLNMVLLPGIDQHLFVFEDRYRAMILDVVGPHDDVLNPEATFGVACIRNGFEVGAPADTYAIGTIARIRRSLQNPERTFDVAVIRTQRLVRLAELAHREAPLIETIGWPLQRPELRANSLN